MVEGDTVEGVDAGLHVENPAVASCPQADHCVLFGCPFQGFRKGYAVVLQAVPEALPEALKVVGNNFLAVSLHR